MSIRSNESNLFTWSQLGSIIFPRPIEFNRIGWLLIDSSQLSIGNSTAWFIKNKKKLCDDKMSIRLNESNLFTWMGHAHLRGSCSAHFQS